MLPAAARLVALLKEVNVTTDADLESQLSDPRLLEHVRNYADSQAVDPEHVSCFAVIALIVLGESARQGASTQMFSDPALEGALSP